MPLGTKISEIVADIPVTFGVAIKYLESGEEVMLNADCTYQMASVFKVPVLVTAMQQSDAGKLNLNNRIKLKDTHKTMPSGILAFLGEGLCSTVEDLLMLMIIISDNTATDMLLDLIGGPEEVTESMRKLGLGKEDIINITMSVHELFEDVFDTSECLLKRSGIVARLKQTGVNFDGEVYGKGSTANVATPKAITYLYEKIFRGEAASRKSCQKILDILLHQTLNDCLPADLPPGTPVAHKTGTIGGIRNDSGIIYISDNCHAAVTIFTRKVGELDMDEFLEQGTEEMIQIDKAIGQIGRLVYDHGLEIA